MPDVMDVVLVLICLVVLLAWPVSWAVDQMLREQNEREKDEDE